MSLDGYIADEDGNFDWAAPPEEVHAFINDLERPIGTYLYGRRLYEVMAVWDTMDVGDEPAPVREYAAIWRAADKVVYSRTLEAVSSARTRIEREFDPAAVRRLKEQSDRDLGIGGGELAAHAFRAGLVDECYVFIAPYLAGGGTPGLPSGVPLALTLREERRFDGGMVYLRYDVGPR